MTKAQIEALLAANITDNTTGLNTAARVRAVLEAMIDASVNTSGVAPMVYRAILNQTGASAPTVTVLQNDFSQTITWSYNAEGDYRMTASSALFLSAKTFINCAVLDADNFAYTKAIRSSDTVIIVNSFDASAYPIESLQNGKMVNVPIEVIVYP